MYQQIVCPSLHLSIRNFYCLYDSLKVFVSLILLLETFVYLSASLSVALSINEYVSVATTQSLLPLCLLRYSFCGSCLKQHLLFYNLLTMAINPFVVSAIYHIPWRVIMYFYLLFNFFFLYLYILNNTIDHKKKRQQHFSFIYIRVMKEIFNELSQIWKLKFDIEYLWFIY